MQHVLNQVLNIQMSSTNEDSTPSEIRRHFINVNKLKEITRTNYIYNFFANGLVKVISTGKEVPAYVLFSASMTGKIFFTNIVRELLITNQLSIYHKITKNKIKTGIAEVPKNSKPIEVTKENFQGFAIFAEQKVQSATYANLAIIADFYGDNAIYFLCSFLSMAVTRHHTPTTETKQRCGEAP